MHTRSLRLEELTWPEIRDAIGGGLTTVIIPVGATEQHGPHLPLATDSLHTLAMLEGVARRLPALVAPLLPIGCSDHHLAFAGTLSVSRATLTALVLGCCASLARHGFQHILIYSGHGGNADPLAAAITAIQPQLPSVRIVGCTDWTIYDHTLFAEAARHGIDRTVAGGHSGELEASMILAINPGLVLMDRAEAGYLGDPEAVRPHIFRDGIQSVTPNGVLGDPRPGQAARGAAYLEVMVDRLTEFFQREMASGPASA